MIGKIMEKLYINIFIRRTQYLSHDDDMFL